MHQRERQRLKIAEGATQKVHEMEIQTMAMLEEQ